MRAIRLSQCQACTELWTVSMCSTLSSTSCHQEQIWVSTFPSLKQIAAWQAFMAPLRSFYLILRKPMSICKSHSTQTLQASYLLKMSTDAIGYWSICLITTCNISTLGFLFQRELKVTLNMPFFMLPNICRFIDVPLDEMQMFFWVLLKQCKLLYMWLDVGISESNPTQNLQVS